MGFRKKGFSASQTKRTSRRMGDSMIGSHVERPSASRGRHAAGRTDAGTSRVDFSDSRRSRRATRGYVDQVDPQAKSGESDADFARRTSRRGYVEQIQSQARKRRIAVAVVVAVAVIAVAAVAGVSAYFFFSDSQLSLGDSNAKEALAAPAEGEPYYALCTASLGTATEPDAAAGEAYTVVRIDEAARVLTFVSVPPQIMVQLSDGQVHPLSDARSVGGDAELIDQVEKLLEVEIAHFARTDAAGLERLVDLVGGVPVAVPEEVDDPRAGITVLKAGDQVLNAEQSLVLLRASNFTAGLEMQAKNRAAFTVNLAGRATSGEGLSFASLIGDGASAVSTDWSSAQLIALGDALKPLTEATVYASVVPGRLTESDGAISYEVAGEELASMMEAVRAGNAPEAAEGNIAGVDRATVTVEVRNGSGIQGAAARCGELLTSDGYQVDGVGNVDDGTTYPETLVIYREEENELAAKAVVNDLSAGRVVNGGDFYTFNTDVLVIIGQDWISAG